MPGLDSEKIQAALDADQAKLKNLGYDPEMCLTDLGSTAGNVVADHLITAYFQAPAEDEKFNVIRHARA
jgi:hypothetical protein